MTREQSSGEDPRCPECGAEMTFLEHHDMWLCDEDVDHRVFNQQGFTDAA